MGDKDKDIPEGLVPGDGNLGVGGISEGTWCLVPPPTPDSDHGGAFHR